MSPLEMPLRFVILGCGRMGRIHIGRLLADGRGRVVALFDMDTNAIEALQRELAPDARGFTDLDDLLANTTADAAIICSPTSIHFEQIRACRARGWHVLCEKPLVDRREHILSLIGECRSSGPILSLAYQRRYWPVYRLLLEEIRCGKWGTLRAVTSINSERWQQTIGGTWRDDPNVNLGGFLGDAGSHKIDAVFFATGLTPIDVFARSQTCGSRVEIVTSLSARLEQDVLLTMHFTGHAQTFREDLHLHCEEADLLLRDWQIWIGWNNSLEPLNVKEPRWQSALGLNPITHSELDLMGNPVSGFLDQLLLRTPAAAPPECALPVFDFTQAVLRSSQSGVVERV